MGLNTGSGFNCTEKENLIERNDIGSQYVNLDAWSLCSSSCG
jgi:hypothetical protein